MTKASNSRAKVLIFSALTFLCGFGGGFFMGSASDQTLKQFYLYTPPSVILVDGKMLLSENLHRELERDTGRPVKVLVAENYNDFKAFSAEAEILIASTCWLERLFPVKDLEAEVTPPKWVLENISPDFLTLEHQKLQTIPMLWTFGKSPHATEERLKVIATENEYAMTLIGIKILKDNNELLPVLTSKKWMQKWIESLPLSTTYMTLDEELIENTQKARYFRELDFRKIKKINPLSPQCDEFSFNI